MGVVLMAMGLVMMSSLLVCGRTRQAKDEVSTHVQIPEARARIKR